MTRNEFIDLLRKATTESVSFARQFVENDLPDAVRYHVLLNQSFDGNRTPQVRVYPADDGREHLCLSEDEVGDVLFREGRCPEWIDISVESQSAIDTRVQLLCCGRFTDDPRRLYYAGQGTGPFGIKSPTLPYPFTKGIKFRLPMVSSRSHR